MNKKEFVKKLFVFDKNADADILGALDDMPDGEKSRTVRDALRVYLGMVRFTPTLNDVMEAISQLRSEVHGLKVHGSTEDGDQTQPEEEDKYASSLLKLGY